jgi:hypothetical protein
MMVAFRALKPSARESGNWVVRGRRCIKIILKRLGEHTVYISLGTAYTAVFKEDRNETSGSIQAIIS